MEERLRPLCKLRKASADISSLALSRSLALPLSHFLSETPTHSHSTLRLLLSSIERPFYMYYEKEEGKGESERERERVRILERERECVCMNERERDGRRRRKLGVSFDGHDLFRKPPPKQQQQLVPCNVSVVKQKEEEFPLQLFPLHLFPLFSP